MGESQIWVFALTSMDRLAGADSSTSALGRRGGRLARDRRTRDTIILNLGRGAGVSNRCPGPEASAGEDSLRMWPRRLGCRDPTAAAAAVWTLVQIRQNWDLRGGGGLSNDSPGVTILTARVHRSEDPVIGRSCPRSVRFRKIESRETTANDHGSAPAGYGRVGGTGIAGRRPGASGALDPPSGAADPDGRGAAGSSLGGADRPGRHRARGAAGGFPASRRLPPLSPLAVPCLAAAVCGAAAEQAAPASSGDPAAERDAGRARGVEPARRVGRRAGRAALGPGIEPEPSGAAGGAAPAGPGRPGQAGPARSGSPGPAAPGAA